MRGLIREYEEICEKIGEKAERNTILFSRFEVPLHTNSSNPLKGSSQDSSS
jgi:hypothetical protein